jgi:hypothetical protein
VVWIVDRESKRTLIIVYYFVNIFVFVNLELHHTIEMRYGTVWGHVVWLM